MTPRSFVEIDLGALRRNLRRLRAHLGPGVRIYGVCKGDAYGCGVERVGATLVEEGCDAFAVGDPEEAAELRHAGVKVPILLYGSTDPALAGDVAALGITVTAFDLAGLAAFAATGRPVELFLKLDCGFGRLGLTPDDWPAAFAALRAAPSLRLRGLYTHLGAVEDPPAVARQVERFRAAATAAEAAGFRGLELTVASSRVAIGYPADAFNAVNPGRILYGLLDEPWASRFTTEPVIRAVKSRVIQVKTVARREDCIGYGGIEGQRFPMRGAVLPIGFVGGLPRVFHGGAVLIRGRRAPTVGLASMEHLLVDVSDVPGIEHGDEAVLLGAQGNASIAPTDLGRMTGLEPLEILTRLARSLPRRYVET